MLGPTPGNPASMELSYLPVQGLAGLVEGQPAYVCSLPVAPVVRPVLERFRKDRLGLPQQAFGVIGLLCGSV